MYSVVTDCNSAPELNVVGFRRRVYAQLRIRKSEANRTYITEPMRGNSGICTLQISFASNQSKEASQCLRYFTPGLHIRSSRRGYVQSKRRATFQVQSVPISRLAWVTCRSRLLGEPKSVWMRWTHGKQLDTALVNNSTLRLSLP